MVGCAEVVRVGRGLGVVCGGGLAGEVGERSGGVVLGGDGRVGGVGGREAGCARVVSGAVRGAIGWGGRGVRGLWRGAQGVYDAVCEDGLLGEEPGRGAHGDDSEPDAAGHGEPGWFGVERHVTR